MEEWDIRERLKRIERKLGTVADVLKQLYALLTGEQLTIDVSPATKENVMPKVSFKLQPKGKLRAVANPVTITGPVTIALTVVDDAGVPVPGITSDMVTTTIVSDNPAVTLSKTDELNYTGSLPAGTTGTANLSATCAFKSGSPGPFTASIACTLQIPATPPVPADLTITVTPS